MNVDTKVHDILGVPVAPITMSETVVKIMNYVKQERFCMVATANAEMVMRAKEDQELLTILRQAELVVPDGAGILWAGEKMGYHFPERVTGADLAETILLQAQGKGWKVYFLGGASGVAEKAIERFTALHGAFPVAGVHDGYFNESDEACIIEDIQKSGAKILLVALGVPKQEKWIFRHRESLGALTAIGVGGVFDVMSGQLSRAPLWMQEHRLEWAYRLYLQPSRIVRMGVLPKFMYEVMRWKK